MMRDWIKDTMGDEYCRYQSCEEVNNERVHRINQMLQHFQVSTINLFWDMLLNPFRSNLNSSSS